MLERLNQWLQRQRYAHIVAAGYLLLITLGACLLTLPCASRAGETDFVRAFFTATSATCVTGLVVADTWSAWTFFGQAVILALIQVGGLGFMTVIVLIPLALGQRIGLKARSFLMESVNAMSVGGIVRLFRRILLGTLLFECAGAVLLMFRFVPSMGGMGVWYAFFHSISAFCNAGFDLFGAIEPYSSVVSFQNDPLVSGVLMALIVLGGIGFFVWSDIAVNKWHYKRYHLHTRVVLVTSGILIVGGAALFLLAEWNGAFRDMDIGTKLNAALFCSVTPRTAGFNIIDMAGMRPASKFITDVLMFIGGSPGSTAGGMKTTTVVAMLVALRMTLRRDDTAILSNRRLEPENILRAASVFMTGILLVVAATTVILLAQPGFAVDDVLFETLSALNTVGLSIGVTGRATPITLGILALLMYLGRVGSMSFALMFTEQKRPCPTTMPVEKIAVG